MTAAGVDACGPLDGVPADAWERVVAVNLLGTAAVVRAALPHLVHSNGKVVTVASTLGLRALPDATAYCASKFGVVGFTRALAAETAGRVGVTLLIPGGMHTAFFDGRPEQYKPSADAKLNRPEDVAQAVLFALCQPPGCEAQGADGEPVHGVVVAVSPATPRGAPQPRPAVVVLRALGPGRPAHRDPGPARPGRRLPAAPAPAGRPGRAGPPGPGLGRGRRGGPGRGARPSRCTGACTGPGWP